MQPMLHYPRRSRFAPILRNFDVLGYLKELYSLNNLSVVGWNVKRLRLGARWRQRFQNPSICYRSTRTINWQGILLFHHPNQKAMGLSVYP